MNKRKKLNGTRKSAHERDAYFEAVKNIINAARQKKGLPPTSDPEYILHKIRSIKSLSGDHHVHKNLRKLGHLAARAEKATSHLASKSGHS